MVLWKKMTLGLVLGTVVGFILGDLTSFLKPIGDLFLNAIKMLIVPLIFSSLVTGVASVSDVGKMGRLGVKSFGLYFLTTIGAIVIGLIVAHVIRPGISGHTITMADYPVATESSIGFSNSLVDIIPVNPIASFAEGNVLQIIVFAVFFGIAIQLCGAKGQSVKALMQSLADVMVKLTELIIACAPYGVFCLIAHSIGQFGLSIILPLIKVIGSVYLACLIHVLVVYSLPLIWNKLSFLNFLSAIRSAQVLAFSSTSSAGTLPVTMKCVEQNLHVDRSVSSFVLPLGATINMDGTAIYQGVCVVFVAQLFQVDLTTLDLIKVVLIATLSSIGTAGVPGAGMIMLSLVLTSIHLPISAIALIAGIDRILDMARTTVNVTGDAMVAVVVAKSEGDLL